MIQVGAGLQPAGFAIKNVRLLDVISGQIHRTDVALVGDRIVGTHDVYHGLRELDGEGRFCVPGFIDTHLHIESSLVTPFEFDRCVLPHGVTTAICDPHEIANVLGASGIRYFLDCAARTIMDVRINLSSCVPATGFETSGASLGIADLLPFASDPRVIGLAEFMNFPGVLAGDPEVLAKLAAFQGRHIDGHAPLLRGMALNGYLAAGIRTDHECTTADEAREKIAKGMIVLIREGSVSKDLAALAEVLDEQTSSVMALCTDDRNPLDIAEGGHIDGLIRMLIARGRPLHHVYRAATWSAAQAFGLRDRGLVAPGWRADLVLLDSLEDCSVSAVISGGRLVDDALFETRSIVPAIGFGSVKAPPVTAESFRVSGRGDTETSVIGVKPGLIITEHLRLSMQPVDGHLQVDREQDLVKVAVVERHGRNGNIATAFVRGFGLKRGAIASSVGHDSHNITVIGVDEADMATAVTHLSRIGGGFAVVADGQVLAALPLPVAGLMSDRPFDEVRGALHTLRDAVLSLGCVLPEPFLQIAFLPLPVIPHLKITDRGLFDVDRFALL